MTREDRSLDRRLRAGIGWLARDRLVVFTLVGAALFVTQRSVGGRDGDVITVSGPITRELERELADRLGRVPTDDERTQALAVWRRDEALYREGLRRGLDDGDPIVRRRIIDKLLEIHEQLAPPIPPLTDAALAAWIARNEDHDLVRLQRMRGDEASSEALRTVARDALEREHRRAHAEAMVEDIVRNARFEEVP